MSPKTRAYVLLFFAFFLGGLVGGGIVYGAFWRGQSYEGYKAREVRRLAFFEERLALTPEQRTTVAAILERKHEERRRSWGHFDNEIRGILTPEQQQKFDMLVQERRSRMGVAASASP